jgi:small subunit ribosomal protein S16
VIERLNAIQEDRVAVKIRMKMMGRKHRPFFRICAVDSRHPRDGRVLEELGTYDPMVSDTDARALLKNERIAYWLGVGAQPSQKVKTLIKKYGSEGTHLEAQRTARERLAMPKVVPDAGEPVYIPPAPGSEPAEAPAASAPEAANGDSGQAAEQADEPASVSE